MSAVPSGGVLIYPTGKVAKVAGMLGLRELQRDMGGYVQAVPVEWDDDGTTSTTLWCNEDGKAMGLPVNDLATRVWWTLCPEMANRDNLVGTVLFTGPVQESGYGQLTQAAWDVIETITTA
ncbi:hypothetical protein SEA_TYPHA_39 [Mycobacterium phage Typha]|uniref:DUF3846 domain-containing protein n=1 Tax=Mycobacterium phage Typha TaxID=2517971 RepID=A0A482JDH2_9CAUD|nr:hypothetical protein KCH40_gp039 [Mycobacterium phage Typha]QBP29696.1 hypothetical protein SEA_TYPHA_39 [Mycobacterium phage Typha]URM86483.1 hypothetical protein PBI_HILLTOPFARM_39 [Mycobacterium phage Hilltopfarm]